jgi:hypothetical protein
MKASDLTFPTVPKVDRASYITGAAYAVDVGWRVI